jgi:hypothetical protein
VGGCEGGEGGIREWRRNFFGGPFIREGEEGFLEGEL